MRYDLNKYKFFIANNSVIAVSTYAGKKVRGVAKCNPNDEFSLEAGQKLAAARCNLKIAEKRAKRAKTKFDEAIIATANMMEHRYRMKSYFEDSYREFENAKTELNELLQQM